MTQLKGKGDPSQVGVLPLGQIDQSLQRSGRYILETQFIVPNLSSVSLSAWYICFWDTACAFPAFGFGLPYKHNDYKEKVNYLNEMKENESWQ